MRCSVGHQIAKEAPLSRLLRCESDKHSNSFAFDWFNRKISEAWALFRNRCSAFGRDILRLPIAAVAMLFIPFLSPVSAAGLLLPLNVEASPEGIRVGETSVTGIILAQFVSERSHLLSYFLDHVPADISVSTMPRAARDVVVARASLTQRPLYLVQRDMSGEQGPPPKHLFRARLKLLEVLSGSARVGEIDEVVFGAPNDAGKRMLHPLTPPQISRDYVVVIYRDDSDQRRLAGFPIDESQYQAWQAEVRGFYGPWGEPKKRQ